LSHSGEALRDHMISNLRRAGPPALIDLDDGVPQARVDGDEMLLEAMLAGELPQRVQRIWTNRPCIVATRAQSCFPGFARAAAAGLPVAIRLSAGSAVVHHGGTLQISLIEALQAPDLEAGYRRLLDLLAAALEPLGIRARPAAIAGAYCDGRFNLCTAKQKIGGTAAFLRTRQGRSAGVFHACVTVSGNVCEDVALVSRFEQALGQPGLYRATSHSSVLAASNVKRPM
jgi:octanoyl-[GcvH]:protein N-octanoyltransferase